MSTSPGRSGTISIPLDVSEYHRRALRMLLDGSARKASVKLTLRDDGTCRVLLALEVPVAEETDVSGWLGIDLGIVNVAVTSTNQFYGGRSVRYRKGRWHERRKALRSCGRLARVKAERGREAAWVRDMNHKIARSVVDEAKAAGIGIALENLTGFHSREDGRGAKLNRMSGGWSFDQLKDFITYKAALRGVPVVFVDPRNTSKTCSRCGHYSKSSRRTQATFRCVSCGFELNADLNAARNIAAKAAASHAERAGLARKGERGTPKSSGPLSHETDRYKLTSKVPA